LKETGGYNIYIFEETSIHFYLYVFIHTNSCEGFGRLLFSIFPPPFYGRFAQYVNNNIYAHRFFFIVQYKYIYICVYMHNIYIIFHFFVKRAIERERKSKRWKLGWKNINFELCARISKKNIQNTGQGLKVHTLTHIYTHARTHTRAHKLTLWNSYMEMCELLHGNLFSFK